MRPRRRRGGKTPRDHRELALLLGVNLHGRRLGGDHLEATSQTDIYD